MASRTHVSADLSHLPARVRRHIRSLGFDSEDSYRNWCRSAGLAVRTNKNPDQMKEEVRRRRAEETDEDRVTSLNEHIRNLGLGSIESYKVWCRRNGFGQGLHKSASQRSREIAATRSLPVSRASDGSRARRKDISRTFSEIARGMVRKRDLTDPVLIRLHELVHACRDGAQRSAFRELIIKAHELGVLLDTAPVFDRLGGSAGNSMLGGLFALSAHHSRWRRTVSEWQPATKSRRQLFASLARHLLAEYPVPPFMDEAWFEGTGEQASRRQLWFVHVGSGRNIRTADLPIHLTKRMAHLFLTAPGDFTITEALRWAQVLGLGGDSEMANHIVATRLGETLEHDDFWVEVVHFFVNNPMLDYDHFGPIVDFVYNRRFVATERRQADGSVVTVPADPGFSMKGRTAERLLELVDGWHHELARAETSTTSTWPPSNIRPFEKVEERHGAVIRWTIRELRTRKELIEEGRAMHHCVGSYARYCARGQKSVWSLSVEEVDSGYADRVMTIAVNNSGRRVVQARGRCNAMPGKHPHGSAAARVLRSEGDRLRLGRAIMHQWGETESILVPRIT